MTELKTDSKGIGGAYTAIENPDGTWQIQNVPIFAEHEITKSNGRKFPIDSKWLQAAIEKAQERLKEGYLPPLHVFHHQIHETQFAGRFIPTKVVRMKYEGKDRAVLLANLLDIPAKIYERIKAGELAYRSVEIHDIEEPEIASLALLQDEVPFFRFPLLTIGKEERNKLREKEIKFSQVKICEEQGSPVYMYRSSNVDIANVLSVFKGESMKESFYADTTKTPPMTEEEKKKKEGAEGEKAQDPMAVIGQKLDKILEMLAALVKMEKKEEGEEAAPESTEGGTAPVEMKQSKRSEEVAYQRGEIAALKAKVEAIEKEKKVQLLVANAMKQLKGYYIGEDGEKQIYSLAKDGGELAVKAFVDGVKRVGILEPPESADSLTQFGNPDPKEVAEYAAKGPEVLERARKYSAMYDELKERGMAEGLDRKSFIEDQFLFDARRIEAANGKRR